MIKIHAYEPPSAMTFNLVINGMRNSWESYEKGDSSQDYKHNNFILGSNDRKLALNLATLHPSHGKYLRQLPVILDFSAPEYFLKEFDTYKVGTTSNSTSMMHVLGKHPFDETMFSFEDLSEQTSITVRTIITLLNELRDEWIASGKKKPSNEWRAMLQAIPQSWIYRRLWSGNYQVLRDIYQWRRNHRQSEWHMFCDWIEILPYAELITAGRDE